MLEEIAAGDVVAGLEPDEHVEVRRLTPFGSRVLLEGVGVNSRREIRRPLDQEELKQLTKVRGNEYSFDGDPEAFLLGAEAQRIRIAHQFDPLFAVSSSIVDVLPHQVEAVYRYLLPLPRIRFLLADDTGAGKTIMAGLLIKELLFRGVISKVLIVTPGGLTRQWQDEMQEKFGLTFRLINRASFEAEPGQFARSDEGYFITSIDFISRHDGCLNAAKETQWDIIVVDEAHKLSAYEYGNKIERSGRYQAIEALSSRTDHLLFLTATPHRGRRDTFRRLLMLLDEDLFLKDEHVTLRIHEAVAEYSTGTDPIEGEEAISKARNRFFLRRLKEEMVDWNNQPLFKPRHTKTLGYNLTPEELELYNAVTRYVRSRRRQAKEQRNRNVELTLMVMQRRLASSIYAITRTLENRLNALNEVLEILRDPSSSWAEKRRLLQTGGEDIPDNVAEYEELDENQRDAIDKRIFRQVLTADPAAVEQEREEVAELLATARALSGHTEAKFAELLRVLDSSDVIRREDEKLLIFTEHKDTLINLTERLERRGYSVTNIHGGMGPDERKERQRDFHYRDKIMVATDAAGEGINLQFCRYLINWDIPWNPNRLEQRMGRIHRYGQQNDVWVYNLVATNTREGAVLEKILTKLDVMREQMGDDRVYDVIEELMEDVPLLHLIERSIDAEDARAVIQEAEQYTLGQALEHRAQQLVELQKRKTLSSSLDLREARNLRDASDERRLQPRFVQAFFMRAYQAAGGTVIEDRHFPVFHLGRTPTPVLDAARRARLPVAEKYDTPFVFDKHLVSVASKVRVPEQTKLLGPGHPLFDAVIEWALRRARDAFARGVTLIDPNIAQPERVWLVRSTIEDGRREERRRLAHQQVSVIVADHLGLRETSPANLLNFTTPEGPVVHPPVPSHSTDEVQMWAYEHLTESQLKRVCGQRQRECDLRQKYLETTFTDLIMDLQYRLNDFQQAQLFGDDDVEERQKLEQRIAQLKARKAARLAELDQMLRLSANLPDIITSALVLPAPVATAEDRPEAVRQGVPMRRDDEIERIAMDVAMHYERRRGWTPYDVSQQGEHYDVRSQSPEGEKRYIEVKGRAQSGPVMLTAAEVDKLRQLGDRAYLYIVTFCRQERPRLHIIQDPMSRLTPEMLYRQVQYLVDERDWQQQVDTTVPSGEDIHDLPTLD
ncbi:MAG: helicase-related protein [Anaerolineae bacterium]|jgi:superfamily II DNA or RNA helicase